MRTEVLRRLAQRISDIEVSERPLAVAALPLGIPVLEDVFADKCLPAGTLVELLSMAEGAGAWTLALLMARQACAAGKVLVVADERRCFYPPAAARLGIDLRRTLVIRPKLREHTLAGLVQSLRCGAVGAALGSFERLSSAEYRRLQLAAETGSVGFLLRPASAVSRPSFAAVRLLVSPRASTGARRRLHVQVVRLRGAKAGDDFCLELDHETGHVCVPAAVADAASVPGAARTSG